MNQPNYPLYAFQPRPIIPLDTIQVQTFAVANQALLAHLNQTLGLNLDFQSYEKLKQYFFSQESKNPTLGELRLLGHFIERASLSERLTPWELYTDSTVIMDTWADIMAGHKSMQGDVERPCSLDRILSLPEAYLIRQRQQLPLTDALRVVSPMGAADAINQGYKPCCTLHSPAGAPRVLWRKTPKASMSADHGIPDVDDVLMVLPPTKLHAINAFMQEHPLADAIKAKAVVQHGSVLQAALELCQGQGLSVQLNDLVPPAPTPEDSRIQKYLDVWEANVPTDTAYAVFCVAPAMKNLLGAAMVEYGFRPHLYGTITKKPFVIITDTDVISVKLKAPAFNTAPLAVRPYRSILPVPEPMADRLDPRITRSPLQYLEAEGCTLADCTTVIEGAESDGFTPSVQSILSLCCYFAASGICYDDVRISPVLYYDGSPEAPLLLSAVCGLYRAATELGIPLTDPKILFKNNTKSPEAASLVLSLVAYSEKAPRAIASTLTAPDRSLCVMSLEIEPTWDDIRGMLFSVARSSQENEDVTAHALHGQSTLSVLDGLASPDVPISAGLFEEHKTLLTQALPFGFLLEGVIPSGGLHIGMTYPRPEDAPLPPPKVDDRPGFDINPYPTVTLSELKDTETQRRKEAAAMEKIKAFEPLCKKPRTVLLDTDIGPDCDDVGALVTLIYYAKQYGFPIGGICNCTSNKAGNGVIDAVCRRCGMETPPLGQWSGQGFMDSIEHCKYNTAVAEAHSEAYRNGTLSVEDEVTFYRKRLAEAKDGDVMIISIGMFNNLAALLESPADEISPLSGMELVKAKVYTLVSMAAILPQGRECNVVSDYPSAEKVFASWPTPIYLSDFHIGVNVKTGYGHITDPEAIMADPLPMSYHLYTKAWNWEGAVVGQNASYDLTAVQFAALGICELYDLDTPGDLEFYAEIPDLPDATRFIENPMGNKIFMTKKVADEVIAESLQKILNSF